MFTYLITNRANSQLVKTPLSTLWWRRRAAVPVNDQRDATTGGHMSGQSGVALGLQVQALHRWEEPVEV